MVLAGCSSRGTNAGATGQSTAVQSSPAQSSPAQSSTAQSSAALTTDPSDTEGAPTEMSIPSAPEGNPPPDGSAPADGTEAYSDSTLLLSVDQQFTDAELKQLCKKYELSVVYQYQNFDMFALKTRHPYTDQEMGDLLENLKAEKNVTDAQRDTIMHLDDGETITNQNS